MGKKILAVLLILILTVTGMAAGCTQPKTGNLEVHIQDANGVPLAGGKVISNEQPEGQLKVTGSTDSNGNVIYKNIAAGEYTFYISRFDYVQKDFTVNVIGGKTTSLTFTLEPDS
jgi:hypothetical protein